MEKIILFIKNRKHFKRKNFFKATAFIAAIFLLQTSTVIAQNMQNTAGKKKGLDSSITIHQEVDFKATPQQVYEVLLNDKEFSAVAAQSGEFPANSAVIDSAVGGAFSLFEGHIIGRNVELVPNQRIVQAWRVVDWPAGIYSIVKFELQPQGQGTHLVFDQTGFPKSLHDHLAEGWQLHYWNMLSKYFK